MSNSYSVKGKLLVSFDHKDVFTCCNVDYFDADSPEEAAVLYCTEYNNPLSGTYDVEVKNITTGEIHNVKVKTEKSWEIIY